MKESIENSFERKPGKFRIYVDEVGNSDLLESSENNNHRFLSLSGVILELSHVEQVVHPEMEALKSRYFHHHPDDPVIFHRKEMVNSVGSFEPLRNREIREHFDSELLRMLRSWDYTVITVCIDKRKHKETYTTWRYDPYHYCLTVLLERFVFFLNRNEARGDVLAESRGGKEDMRLKASFTRLWENGTDYVDPEQLQTALTSKQLKVKTKANNIAGLQLADLIAHPSRNEILKEHGFIDKELAPFAMEVIRVLQKKYDQQPGRIYGKKFI
jgi:hypothetical protein